MSDKSIHDKISEQERKYDKMELEIRDFRIGLKSMRREGAADKAKVVFSIVPSFDGHLTGGKAKGSLHSNFCEISEALKAVSSLDPDYRKEFTLKEPYGVRIDDPVLRYFLDHLFAGVWGPDAALVDILGKLVTHKKVPGNPFCERKVKDVKK